MDGLPGDAGRDELRLAVTNVDRYATETRCLLLAVLVMRPACEASGSFEDRPRVRQAACSTSKQ